MFDILFCLVRAVYGMRQNISFQVLSLIKKYSNDGMEGHGCIRDIQNLYICIDHECNCELNTRSPKWWSQAQPWYASCALQQY